MTSKTPIQNFEDFVGEDITRSPLRTDPNSAVRMENLEKLENGSLRGRQGIKLSAQLAPIFQTHTYFNPETGEEQLIGLGRAGSEDVDNAGMTSIFRLDEATFTINYGAGGDWSYNLLPDTANDRLQFILTDQTVTVLTANLGNGYEASPYTIKDLADAINAVSNFTCVAPKTAVVNGNQTAKVITVDSGHTISAGDWVELTYTSTAFSGSATMQLEVVATSATTLTFNTEVDITVADNMVIGHGRFPAAILPLLLTSEENNASVDITYKYWRQIQYLLNIADTSTYTVTRTDLISKTVLANPELSPVTFTNNRSVAYFTHKDIDSLSRSIYSEVTPDYKSGYRDSDADYDSGVYKYDGYRVRLSLTPELNAPGITGTFSGEIVVVNDVSSSAPLPSGDYRYTGSISLTDCQNNEITFYSPYFFVYTSNFSFDALIGIPVPSLDEERRNPRRYGVISAALTSTASATATLAITSGHQLRAGDYIYYTDSSDSKVYKARVVSSTLAGVVLDKAISAASGSIISTAKFSLWRTQVNTADFYLHSEYPWEVETGATEHLEVNDDVTDNELGIALTSVQPVQTQYPFPPANAIAVIQGSLVVGGGNTETYQQIHWEDATAPESSPRSASNTRIPTRVSGDIQQLIESSLAGVNIYKPLAQYSVSGEFPSNTIQVYKDFENSYGASNSYGAVDVDKIVYGVGPQGIWARVEQEISQSFGKNYETYFINVPFALEDRFRLRHARVFYDHIRKNIHFLLPKYASNEPTEDTVHIVYNPRFQFWSRYIYTKDQYANGGMAIADNIFYMQNWSYDATNKWRGYLHQRLSKAVSSEKYDYHDNGSTYDYDYFSAWDDNGDPDSYKFWTSFILYSVQPNYFIDAFTVKFESYRDWVENATKKDTSRDATLVFSSSSVSDSSVEFDKNMKHKRRAFRLYGTIDLNPPIFTGYQYLLDDTTYSVDRKTP